MHTAEQRKSYPNSVSPTGERFFMGPKNLHIFGMKAFILPLKERLCRTETTKRRIGSRSLLFFSSSERRQLTLCVIFVFTGDTHELFNGFYILIIEWGLARVHPQQ